MASDSEDSEGEDLAMLRPSLIRELRNVLDLYPDDGQILKELIQNAEDAGATEVKVLTDKRTFNQDVDPDILRRHPHLRYFQGPALCVYNNATFTASDWKGIRMLHTSVKEEDPLKVGRFGLGFKSVFHLTDYLVILSGDYIMYMDPFKGEDHYCKRHRVTGRKGTELESILRCLNDVFGVCRNTFLEEGGCFPGTLFWFPLRQKASDLSSTLYAHHNVEQLLASFKAEAGSILLFLNHILGITVLSRDDTQGPQELFSVGVASSGLREVQSQRQSFVEQIKSAAGGLPRNEVISLTEVVMETRDYQTSSTESQLWLVANYHGGVQQMSKQLSKLSSDPQLQYRPHVGVAIPLSNQSSFQSQIFCFLPLPLDTRSPTGLPVHVHGYFALEQNRRHLKWPAADQLANQAQLSSSPLWNCLLVTELLPRVYCLAICRLKVLKGVDVEKFYAAWPDAKNVHDRWRPLLQPLYQQLEQEPLFFSHVQKGAWVLIKQAILLRFAPGFAGEVEAAVVKVYTLSDQKLVDLPEHVYQSLNKFGLLKGVNVIQASQVALLIPHVLPRLSRDERLCLLHYLYRAEKHLLLDQTLLPLADGTSFETFKTRPKKKSKKSGHVSLIHWCPKHLIGLFPGLEREFCDVNIPEHVSDDLSRFAETGLSTLDRLLRKDPRIPALLQKSLRARFQTGAPAMEANDPWIQRVWQYLNTVEELSSFSDIALMPATVNPLNSTGENPRKLRPLAGIYVYRHAAGFPPLSQSLASALAKLCITVVEWLPDYIIRHRKVLGHFINYPSDQGVLKAIQQIDANSTVKKEAIRVFNASASGDEKAEIIRFICRNGHPELPPLFQDLELFMNVLTRKPASVGKIPHVGPEDLPPVSMPAVFLLCDQLERQAAMRLGAKQMTLLELVYGIMEDLTSERQHRSPDDVIQFMRYFLGNKELMKEPSLMEIAKGIRFVRTESNEQKTARDLYDPTIPLLRELFRFQYSTLFPSGEFAQENVLKKLRKLGLRGAKDVKTDDLVNTAKTIFDLFSTNQQGTASKIAQKVFTFLTSFGQAATKTNQKETAVEIAQRLFTFLEDFGYTVSITALQSIATTQCMPCIQDTERPKDYPKSLVLRSSPEVAKPSEMTIHSLLYVTGSVMPVLAPGLSTQVVDRLQVITEAQPEDVLQHLKNVVENYQQGEASEYRLVLKEILQFFSGPRLHGWAVSHLPEEECVLVESGERFARPGNFWIERDAGDIDLKPYRFALPVEIALPAEMEDVRGLLEACGSSKNQNELMLQDVLSEIQAKHCEPEHPDFHSDFQLVKQILDVLKRSEKACDGNTLLPVFTPHHTETLKFMDAKHCAVYQGTSSDVCDNASAEMGIEICFVHPDISNSTALALGALSMKDFALTDVEELDFTYGQREDLTDRLSNLLKEAYTDGFSVPKELIQNADDAGASKVCFLLDERENLSCRSNLVDEKMASLQGPAIWVYNDAEFSERDFENIVKLGSGTKKDDTTKVGRFGLGFNAVYNLTDVPSFISGHKLAMFDPQMKYIRRGKGGLMIDFKKSGQKALLLPEQFEPFQDVFGCTLKPNKDTYYRGTLFRLPLRTADQADTSKLKSDSYSESKRREFLRMLLEKAGTLLMFTQSVSNIEVYYLPDHCSDPTNKKCLLTVQKTGSPTIVQPPKLQIGHKTILQFMNDHWSESNKDIKMQQKLCIEFVVTKEAKGVCDVEECSSITHWQLAWASGSNRSAKMAKFSKQQGLVPLAAVAVSVDEDQIIPLKDSPNGFYKRGHLFCFLPLPEEMVRFSFPVHINGTFALTSDRRGLFVQTEDDLEQGDSSWNPVLFGDPVVRAYMLLLELVRKEAAGDTDLHRYFELWPTDSMECLADSFYQHLHSDHSKVFPVPDHNNWVSFADSWFLEPDFRKSKCGEIAWNCLQKFWKGPGYLVDVPYFICSLMKEKGPKGSFEKQVITELAFYTDYFFPHLQDCWWQPECRDLLIHHALMKNNEQINQLIKDNSCIPCDCSCHLRKPSELIHPCGQVAKLFLTSEGYFPQKETKETSEKGEQRVTKVGFHDHTTLMRLCGLGMIKDELPWEKVVERAESVGQLNADKSTEDVSLARASCLVEYLSSSRMFRSDNKLEKCPQTVIASLSETAFLPVLPKPDDWPFPWAAETPASGRLLASPQDLFSDDLKNLVSCRVKLLDTKVLQKSRGYLTTEMKEVLKTLGLTVSKDYSNKRLCEIASQQLTCVEEHCKNDSTVRDGQIQLVASEVYNYLATCLRRAEDDSISQSIHTELCDKEVIWTGTKFVQPHCVAFNCSYDCSPYLFPIERSLLIYKPFFETIGVKEHFNTDDVLSVLTDLYERHAGGVLRADDIGLASRLAQLVAEIMTSTDIQSLDTDQVYLPDSDGVMQLTSHMCVDDCDWLTESDRMKFVNGMIAPEVAQSLGVKSKKRQDYDTLTELIPMESFGQHEKLTSRIKRLLQGYTFDSSLWKELIQNADDAGATEAKLIMDFRNLGTAKVPEKLEVLQGPAFCFYNNKSFTREDMLGIQNLGVGSKGQDALKIGQFGVGFNAVFHITDVPSFWTKEDDEKDVICVLDPNCKYVPNTKSDRPGIKFTNIERIQQQYPDFMSGYLSTAIDMSQSGTLFRFPLRTEDMAAISEIKTEAVSENAVRELLESFRDEMAACLLFLNSLEKIGIYSVNEDGSLELQFDVSRTVQDVSMNQVACFRTALRQASQSIKQDTANVKDIEVCEAVVQFDLSCSSGRCEQWLAVHRLGITEGKSLSPALLEDWSKEHFRLLPRGGVAVRLREMGNGAPQKGKATEHQAFCTLPLPVFTGLPMHVNGHFALDHETRRNLWDSGNNKGDVKSEWNEIIATGVIVPAYLTALQHAKSALFPADGQDIEGREKSSRLDQYHNMFPHAKKVVSEIWNNLTQEIYKNLATQELPLFPVSFAEDPKLEWMPAVRKDGFPGYFNNLTEHFISQMREKEPAKPVILSQGVSPGADHQPSAETKAKTLSKELELLLKQSNMKILEAPFHIYEHFKSSGVEEVQQVTPGSVLEFLGSSSQRAHGGCCITDLPKNVSDTPLIKAENVQKLVKFVSKDPRFLDSLDGLPLSLRQSGMLHWFDSHGRTPKPVVSQFSHLLPGSAENFLHENIRKFFRITEQTKSALQQLDIPMFASMLHETLKDPCLRAGKPCVFDMKKFPPSKNGSSWLQDLWTFFEMQLKLKTTQESLRKEVTTEQEKAVQNKQGKETKHPVATVDSTGDCLDKEMRQKAKEMLQIMQEWCVIPVNKTKATDMVGQDRMLYPLLDMHKVVYLPTLRDPSNGALWTILKKLPLPFLHQFSPSSIASKLVASIGHPRALLHALVSCANCLSASHKDGQTILSYFSSNLTTLKESNSNNVELKSELKNLPVFPAIDEKLVSIRRSIPVICLKSSVPSMGLAQWSQQRKQPVTLLWEVFIPTELIKYLEFQTLTDAEFYVQYLLPTISDLPRSAIVTHMKFLREHFFRGVYPMNSMNEEQKRLCLQLKVTAFIEAGGALHRAEDFRSPHEPVFRVMCPERFPPDPYRSTEWAGLMTASGMICEITDDMFLSFARDVERFKTAEITEEVVRKSETLVGHLFARQTITNGLLLNVCSIQFLLPSKRMASKEGEQLQKIAPSYSGMRLVSFAESCLEQNLHLVWTSSCLLRPGSEPRWHCSSKTLKKVMSQLGLEEKAPKGKVIQHVRNICNRLGGDEGSRIFTSLADNKRLLIIVMEKLYRYLEDHLKGSDMASLTEIQIICDIENSQMLRPANVVMDLRPNEMIKGHIEKAPHHFGRYFEFFQKLGASQNVTANHYARVLLWLKKQSDNEQLHVEEWKMVKTAVDGLFRCLRDGTEEQKKMTVHALYLPTEDKTLQDSTQLIFKDYRLGDRFETPPDGMYFFMGFEKLKVKVFLPQEDIKRLPPKYKIVLMSEIAHEIIPDEIQHTAQEADPRNPVASRLVHPGVVQAIMRLVYHQCKISAQPFTEDTAKQVLQTLENVSVKEVPKLKTIITMSGKRVEGTEHKKKSFTEKKEGDPRMAVVFVDAKAAKNWSKYEGDCIHSLAIALQFVFWVKLDSHLLHYVLQKPGQTQAILDEERIPQCTFNNPKLDDTLFPAPGKFIPLHSQQYLNNSFSDFYRGEHVGFEVCDPEIDDVTQDKDNNAVYVYGIILGEVHYQTAEKVSRLTRRYHVDLGPDRGKHEVSVIKLYKFIRASREEIRTVMVQNQEDSEAETEASAPPEMRAVLAEIRSLLTEAWQLPDEKDRKHVVKRLLLQWHPDKNRENEEFCTRVTQTILHYVKLLEQGKKLPSDNVDGHSGTDADDEFFRSGSSFSSKFFTNMHARGRRHRSYSDAEASGGGSRSRGHGKHKTNRNPQPGESRRWFRQARADVGDAKAAADSCQRGYNWICRQCYEGVEKALKALLLQRDADSVDANCHDISSLVESVAEQGHCDSLVDLVEKLETRVGPYDRMCYPDVMVYPRIPAEVYQRDDALFACAIAAQILDRCQQLMKD